MASIMVNPTGPVEDFDAKLEAMGHKLPPTSSAVGIYKSVVVVDNMAYLAGHIPRTADGEIMRGKVGEDVSLEQAQKAAERSALAMLASLKAELGSLNRIKRLVKTTTSFLLLAIKAAVKQGKSL